MINENITLEFKVWVNAVTAILYGEGYVLTENESLWNEVQFLFEDDLSPTEAVEYLLA